MIEDKQWYCCLRTADDNHIIAVAMSYFLVPVQENVEP